MMVIAAFWRPRLLIPYPRRDERSERTRDEYAKQWRAFSDWCEDHQLCELPASAQAVAMYLSARADEGRKVATLAQALAAISQAHIAAGHKSPRAHKRPTEPAKWACIVALLLVLVVAGSQVDSTSEAGAGTACASRPPFSSTTTPPPRCACPARARGGRSDHEFQRSQLRLRKRQCGMRHAKG
jgi:hypothetical protein